jgi:hypothetical protein
MGSSKSLPPGRHWVAPDGTEYIVAVVNVTERPPRPEVVPMRGVLQFYRDGEMILERALPNYRLHEDPSEEQILRLYLEGTQ